MNPLYEHQTRAVEFLRSRKYSGALIHEPGCGKTRTVIETVKEIKESTPNLAVLVIAPLSILEAAWGQDIFKWSKFSYINCHAHRKWYEDKMAMDHADFFVMNYEALRSQKHQTAVLHLISLRPVLCVLDESSRIKSHNTQTTKLLLKLASSFQYRIILSGTPTPNSELEWWGQINFVQPYVLGKSFHQFKNRYFHLQRGNQTQITRGQFLTAKELSERFRTGWKYDITQNNRKLMMGKINPYCNVVKKSDCLDLPEQIDMMRYVAMTSKQKQAYKDLKTHLISEIDNKVLVAQNALTKIMKLREITSGFCFDDDGKVVEIGSTKFDELSNIISDLGAKQSIIWCNYKWEIWKVKELLEKVAPVCTLYSATKDRNDSITGFQNGTYRYLIAHPLSAAHGLTFVNCDTQIYFSLSYSYEQYEQSRARIHRPGQENKCVYYHILCDGTIDIKILSVVKDKKDAQEIIMELVK